MGDETSRRERERDSQVDEGCGCVRLFAVVVVARPCTRLPTQTSAVSGLFPRWCSLADPGSPLSPSSMHRRAMSTVSPPPNGTTTTSTAAPTTRPGVLVATNTVTTKDGTTVRARIDPSLAVDDVIRQLCVNLKIQEPPVMFALRDDVDELVTDDNLRRKIKDRVGLKSVPLHLPPPLTSFSSPFQARQLAHNRGVGDCRETHRERG